MRTFVLALLALAGCYRPPLEMLLTPKDGGGGGVADAGIDECALGLAHCDPHATCVDTPDAFTCTCESGYEGDGATCRPVASQLAAGGYHTCEVRTGELWCWGANASGQLGSAASAVAQGPARVGNDADWAQVTAGGAHTCAVKQSGALICFGDDTYGQLGMGLGGGWRQVSAGGWTTCAVKTDDTLYCWGHNWYGKLGDGSDTSVGSRRAPGPVAGSWRAVAVADYHVCGIQTDGSLWCWGEGRFGELGDGTPDAHYTPSRVGTDSDWKSVYPGVYTTCADKQSGSRYCFGSDWHGEYGDGRQAVGDGTVHPVPDHGPWRVFSQGLDSSCGVRTDGTLWCGGYNGTGAVGDGTTVDRFAPVQIGADTTWISVAVGWSHACAVKSDGSRWCWGEAAHGQLGPVSTALASVAGTGFTAVAAGYTSTLALGPQGKLFTWGNPLASSDEPREQAPVALWPNLTFGQISMTQSHACAIDVAGALWCWGANASGQLGNGSMMPASVAAPVMAASATRWLAVSAGLAHTCAVRDDHSLWCWGEGTSGQLGDGHRMTAPAPVQVGSASWSSVSAGGVHTCGVQTDGSLWCWGSNQGGRAGLGSDGQTQLAATPQQVDMGEWLAASAGQAHSCALRADHTLWCWGDNHLGAVGDGTTDNRYVPVQIGSASWTSVTAGSRSCGVSGGRLECWGASFADGRAVTAPQPLGAAADWASVAIGETHACALRTDGSLACVGTNFAGELGDGSAWALSPRRL